MLTTWHEVFRHFQKFLEKRTENRKVVFIDELPYMATHKSGCIAAFEHFWNGWATARKDILLKDILLIVYGNWGHPLLLALSPEGSERSAEHGSALHCGRRFVFELEDGKETIQAEKMLKVMSVLASGFNLRSRRGCK